VGLGCDAMVGDAGLTVNFSIEVFSCFFGFRLIACLRLFLWAVDFGRGVS